MKRETRLKVYGGNLDGKHRVICAATSVPAFRGALCKAGLDVSLYYLRQQVSETGNEREIEVAVNSPGTVFQAVDNHKYEFRALT